MSYELLFHNLSDASGYGLWIVHMGGAQSLPSSSVAAVRYQVATTASGYIFSNTSSMGKF